MNLYMVVGARPNFMKIAPLVRTLEKHKDIESKVIHTGQHYDFNMSDVFLQKLNIPNPDVNFGMRSTTHAAIGLMMSTFEEYCKSYKPDVVLVVGDVDSTRAIATSVARMCDPKIKLAHVEAGMRSGERIPEEMNRKITDILSDYCFCTIPEACDNCLAEGISQDKVHLVGDTMIEQLYYALPMADADPEPPQEPYILVTLHRNYNVDDPHRLSEILKALNNLAEDVPVLFPMHPRTTNRIRTYNLSSDINKIKVMEPQGYLQILAYMRDASLVITDSGGMQVETTVLGVPCLTVRNATEHVHTLHRGTNQLVQPDDLEKESCEILNKWDFGGYGIDDSGNASENIIKILRNSL